MIDLSRQHQDTDGSELNGDQLRNLAAHQLARLIAEDVSAALSAYTDKVRATCRSRIGEAAAPAIRDSRDWTSNVFVEAIATIVLARALTAV